MPDSHYSVCSSVSLSDNPRFQTHSDLQILYIYIGEKDRLPLGWNGSPRCLPLYIGGWHSRRPYSFFFFLYIAGARHVCVGV